jgi:poly-gamma-glutamate capsule biosynthesis protein CapA/YwtB (metallophosphatase superfamily)
MQRRAILAAVLVLTWAVCLLAGGGLARAGETAGGEDLLVVNAAGDCAHPVQHYREDLAGLGYRVHEAVRPILARGDLNFVNLETPVTDRSPVLEKTYAFNAPAASLDEMVRAGFNLFSLANNHMADAGPGGIADTEAHLRRLDAARGPLHWAGAGSRRDAVHFRVPGHPQRIAFLALGNDAGVARFEEGAAVAAVRAAAKKADIVLVSVHKGVEYEHRPPAELVRGYRRLIEAGARESRRTGRVSSSTRSATTRSPPRPCATAAPGRNCSACCRPSASAAAGRWPPASPRST